MSNAPRDEIQNKDPLGAQLMKDFLSPDLTYMARIDPNFTGTFKMAFDASAADTHKSQYLTNARLPGNNDSGLSGNARDNVLMGNAGTNASDGKGGSDVVQYQGVSSDYKIVTANGVITVTSRTKAGDTDRLTNVENLRFMDKDIKLAAGRTAGNDSLTGTSGPDDVDLQGGNDSYLGLGGNDVLRGGRGNARLKGNLGEDRLFGGAGHDKLNGGYGRDRLHGGDGNDLLRDNGQTGPYGRDLFFGGNVVFDFGDGNSITLDGVTDIATLADDLFIF